MEPGYLRGEICNRNGCEGIIDEHEKEGSCSCHINPPCSYCTTDTAYCPVCGWETGYEVAQVDPEIQKKNQEFYESQMKARRDAEMLFKKRYEGKEPIVQLEIMSYSHTHFSMLIKGVFPKGTETKESIEKRVQGSFGGRFDLFDKEIGRFQYIAYTD